MSEVADACVASSFREFLDEDRDKVGIFVLNASPVEARRMALVIRDRMDLAGEGEDGRGPDTVSERLGGEEAIERGSGRSVRSRKKCWRPCSIERRSS